MAIQNLHSSNHSAQQNQPANVQDFWTMASLIDVLQGVTFDSYPT